MAFPVTLDPLRPLNSPVMARQKADDDRADAIPQSFRMDPELLDRVTAIRKRLPSRPTFTQAAHWAFTLWADAMDRENPPPPAAKPRK